MSAPRNDEIQTALITKLKATSEIVGYLITGSSSANEIREDQWQGDEFEYPNVRIRLISNTPFGDTAYCNRSDFSVSITVFSEDYSSLEADDLIGIIVDSLSGKSFCINYIELFVRAINLIPAIHLDIRTWKAECLISGVACKITPPWYLSENINLSECIAAWQAKHAPSLAGSYINLANPGTFDLSGATPTWNSSIGWTSYVIFNSIGVVLNPLPITFIWRGKLGSTARYLIATNPVTWNGGLYGYTKTASNLLEISMNASSDWRIMHVYSPITAIYTICYQKLIDNSQRLWVNGIESPDSPHAGTTPTNYEFRLATANNACESAAIYRIALTNLQIAAVINAMATL